MKRRLSESAVRYISYQTMLEHGLTSIERERLLEAGLVSKVMDWLGAGADTAKQMGGAAMQLMKSNEFSRRMVSAEKAISKEIDDLKKLAGKAGQPEEAVYGILKQILDKAGAPAAELENPPAPEAADGKQSGEGEVQPGQPIPVPKPDSPAAASPGGKAVIRTAAALAGADGEKALSNAEEKEITAKDALAQLYKLTAKASKQDAGLTQKVVDYLLKNSLLTAGYVRPTTRTIRMMAESIKQRNYHGDVMNRWLQLAGVDRRASLLSEGPLEDVMKKIGDVKDEKALLDALKKLKPEELEVITTARTNAAKALSKNIKDMDKEKLTAVLEKLPKQDQAGGEEVKLSEKGQTALKSVVDKKIADEGPAKAIIAVLFDAAEEAAA